MVATRARPRLPNDHTDVTQIAGNQVEDWISFQAHLRRILLAASCARYVPGAAPVTGARFRVGGRRGWSYV